MGDKTSIAWCESTWNPLVGCSRVSEGCRHCYAEREAIRQAHPERRERVDLANDAGGVVVKAAGKYHGVVRSTKDGPRWTGEVRLVEKDLDLPLRWKSPRRIFVNSMSDLFHEKVESGWIHRIFDVMSRCQQHTFQILTKRPIFMQKWLYCHHGWGQGGFGPVLPNVWLGVSVEDQPTADERIPLLLQTPAALRWVSYEPALAAVDFLPWLGPRRDCPMCQCWVDTGTFRCGVHTPHEGKLDWLVVGGESGPGARPFDLAWARSVIAQGQAAGVSVFVKQLGARPYVADLGDEVRRDPRPLNVDLEPGSGAFIRLRDRKGADPAEWPEDLRVREFPK